MIYIICLILFDRNITKITLCVHIYIYIFMFTYICLHI